MASPSLSRQDTSMAAHDEVVEITQDLIRIDTSNFGDSEDTVGEAEAAEYCADRLREVGWDPEVIITTSDRRRGMVLRIPGTSPTTSALVVHGHLDVVPAISQDWRFPPFAAEIHEGFIWGRGAVDMKNMDAMMLSVAREWGRSGVRPRRDIIIVFFPDEEAGMVHGSKWFAEHRPDVFQDATHAVGEVGGFSLNLGGSHRLYPIQTAEKGIRWLQLRAQGRAGHGSLIHQDNAVSDIARAVTSIADHEWPQHMTSTVKEFLAVISQMTGHDLSDRTPNELVEVLGTLGFLVGATLSNTANPTTLNAGYKINVIPGEAEAGIDGRVLPGFEAEFDSVIRELVGPEIDIEHVSRDIAVESSFDDPLVTSMLESLRQYDPEAVIAPYMISGGTDAKALSQLGMSCYGFSPLQMPADVDYWRLFHGVDERVPIDGLTFGTDVLDHFLRNA
jgi:acetylornithine deacetylase/succinyl-diaminopimelate desuccinylase-like protein